MKRHERKVCLLVGVILGIICCLTSVSAGAKPQEEAKEQTIRLLVHYAYRLVSRVHRSWQAEFESQRENRPISEIVDAGNEFMEVAQVVVDVAEQSIKALKPTNTQLLSQATDTLAVLRQCTLPLYKYSPVALRAHLERNERRLRLVERDLEQMGAADPFANISLASVTAFLLMQCQFAESINKDFENRFRNASDNDWLEMEFFFMHFYPEVKAIIVFLDDASRFLDEAGDRLKPAYVSEAKGVLNLLRGVYSSMKDRMDTHVLTSSIRQVPPPDWSPVLSSLSDSLPKHNRTIGQARKRVEQIKRLY